MKSLFLKFFIIKFSAKLSTFFTLPLAIISYVKVISRKRMAAYTKGFSIIKSWYTIMLQAMFPLLINLKVGGVHARWIFASMMNNHTFRNCANIQFIRNSMSTLATKTSISILVFSCFPLPATIRKNNPFIIKSFRYFSTFYFSIVAVKKPSTCFTSRLIAIFIVPVFAKIIQGLDLFAITTFFHYNCLRHGFSPFQKSYCLEPVAAQTVIGSSYYRESQRYVN